MYPCSFHGSHAFKFNAYTMKVVCVLPVNKTEGHCLAALAGSACPTI